MSHIDSRVSHRIQRSLEQRHKQLGRNVVGHAIKLFGRHIYKHFTAYVNQRRVENVAIGPFVVY